MDISKLDKKTLEFAIETAWQYGFLCKDTKNGRLEKECYNKVERTLKHYLDMLETEEVSQ